MSWNYARAIRLLRAARGLTQDNVARSCGLHESAVSRYESGERTPTLEKAPEVFKILGCTPQEMVTIAEDWDENAPDAAERAITICRVLFRETKPVEQTT